MVLPSIDSARINGESLSLVPFRTVYSLLKNLRPDEEEAYSNLETAGEARVMLLDFLVADFNIEPNEEGLFLYDLDEEEKDGEDSVDEEVESAFKEEKSTSSSELDAEAVST